MKLKTRPIMKTISTMKTIKFALLTLTAGAVLTACNMQPPGAEGSTETASVEVKAHPVKVMELKYRETAVNQNITSTVVAYEETYLSPALSGRIRSVKVEINDHVKKGELLVEMDRTQLDQTQLQYHQLLTDLARMDTLLLYGSITQQAYDQMKAQVETTELILQNLEENTLLRAPYSGVITGKYYNDGELYSPAPNTPAGKAALVSIIQVDPVKLMVNLSEKNLPLLKEGMLASISTDVYPGENFQGKVFRIHPTISAATRTFTAEVKVPNKKGKLAPGMFARVSLKLGEKEALIVPSIAVMQQAGTNQRYVMLHENGSAKKVIVQIISRHDDQLEISSPELQGGEQLILAGQSQLENGAKVNVVSE
jgi:membrane fusion protein, multidrug efflux system